MQPVKYLKTHEKVLPFQEQAFQPMEVTWPNLYNLKHEIDTN